MDSQTARVLLANLLGRVERDPESGGLKLVGRISELEREALNYALSELGGPLETAGTTPHSDAEPSGESEEDKTKIFESGERIRRNIFKRSRALELGEPLNPEVLLCLDFGTAKSKGFAVRTGSDEKLELLELALGKRAGEAGIYPVTSSLWISDEGLMHFGEDAVVKSEGYGGRGRERLDSLKQQLSQGHPEQLGETPLDSKVNPTGTPLTFGEAITAYLGYLTDLACSELKERYGVEPYVRRRFACPCWEEERLSRGKQFLREALAIAQLLADVFHGRWGSGIPIAEMRAALREAKDLSGLASYLVDGEVLEPIAAASSRIPFDDRTRGLVMVVDVGAGTTDFALFVIKRDANVSAIQVKGSATALRQAGNRLDDILGQAILEKAGVTPRDADFDRVNAALQRRIREYKERLFKDREVTYRLENDSGGTVSLADFLERREVKEFGGLLQAKFQEVLDRAHGSFFETLNLAGLTVVLTGGGATMPMVQALADGQSQPHGFALQHHKAALVPEFIEDKYPELASEYLQLAVAIGGALPDIMREAGSLAEMSGSRPRWKLEGFRTEGI